MKRENVLFTVLFVFFGLFLGKLLMDAYRIRSDCAERGGTLVYGHCLDVREIKR